jgi:hypothetical protein
MRRALLALLLTFSFALHAAPAVPATPGSNLEPEAPAWKGKPYDTRFQFAGLAGVGMFAASTGFSLYGAAAYKILHEGFLEDVNDQAYIEVMGGPLFVSGSVGGVLSAHLRWDFHRNEMWTFYALGGIGAEFGGLALSNVKMFHPRFGAGVLWNVFEFLSFRGEVSHEFTGVGVVYLL